MDDPSARTRRPRHHDSRKRSRSPHHDADSASHHRSKRSRSRSPTRHHHSSDKHSRSSQPAVKLPYNAIPLKKHYLKPYTPLFGEYLDIQKNIDLDSLDRHETMGRWKSFMGKWNRGELAEGWYDPETRRKADERYAAHGGAEGNGTEGGFAREESDGRKGRVTATAESQGNDGRDPTVEEDDDDDYGPAPQTMSNGNRALGPSIPSVQDLQQRREMLDEDRSADVADLRYERKLDRQTQKERLEELVPRAAPGSRERQLEKKRDAAAANKSFRDSKDAGMEEVGDGDLLGDDEGGVQGLKAKRKAQERQKNEREIRKEEVLRARAAEREEKLDAHRKKEEKTMEMLRSMARQRFG